MKRLYYYVPPCPNCGSKRTGRFVSRLFSTDESITEDSLKHGELVRTVALSDMTHTAFCDDCDYEWDADIETRRLSETEIAKEKKDRETQDLYEEVVAERKEEEKDNKAKKILRDWLGF